MRHPRPGTLAQAMPRWGWNLSLLLFLQAKLPAWSFSHDLIVLTAIQPHLLGALQNLINPENVVLLHKFVVPLENSPVEPNSQAVALPEGDGMLVDFLPELFIFNLGHNRSTLLEESPRASFVERELRDDERGIPFAFGRWTISLQLQRLCLENRSLLFFERNLLFTVLLHGTPIYR